MMQRPQAVFSPEPNLLVDYSGRQDLPVDGVLVPLMDVGHGPHDMVGGRRHVVGGVELVHGGVVHVRRVMRHRLQRPVTGVRVVHGPRRRLHVRMDPVIVLEHTGRVNLENTPKVRLIRRIA